MTIITPTGVVGINSLTSLTTNSINFYNVNGGPAQINVGAAITLNTSGINVAGIITSSNFSGNITGNVNSTGVSTFTTLNVTGFSTSTFATYNNLVGVTSTGITTSTVTGVTLPGTGVAISNGDYVTGAGVPPGTVVSSGAGTTNLVLSAAVGFTTNSNVLNFYPNTKPVSAGVLGGQLCRAWINFDGSHATPKIRASYNVSSVTKNGTGDYTVNFTTAMPDANYCAVATGALDNTTGGRSSVASINSYSTGSVKLLTTRSSTAAFEDDLFCNLSIFR